MRLPRDASFGLGGFINSPLNTVPQLVRRVGSDDVGFPCELREVPLSEDESSFVQPITRVIEARIATIRRLFKYIHSPFASQPIDVPTKKVGLLREIFMNRGEVFLVVLQQGAGAV